MVAWDDAGSYGREELFSTLTPRFEALHYRHHWPSKAPSELGRYRFDAAATIPASSAPKQGAACCTSNRGVS
jgi:hypothetical protein